MSSVWYDIGIRNGEMFGVNPCTFLTTAYGFWRLLKSKLRPLVYIPPEYDFSMISKWPLQGDIATQIFWANHLEGYLAPYDTVSFSMWPVKSAFWSGSPDFSGIFAVDTESDLIGETIVPYPYSTYVSDLMDPRWPLQRYAVIQHMRYILVPLDIRLKMFSSSEYGGWWKDADHIDESRFSWGVGNNSCDKIEIAFPEYWQQGDTACKIGINGESGKPISGDFWFSGRSYSYTFSGPDDAEQSLKIFGAVDLATHPDFTQYFDVN